MAHITATWDPQHDSPGAVASLLDRYAEALTNARPSRLLPGTELLNDLHRPLHVSSSAPPEAVVAELEQHGLSAVFESVHGDPPGKLETLRRLRAAYPADAVIMIGDGGADEVAATEAGVTFVGIERETNSFSPGVATYPHLRAALTALFTT
jgi:phosphoglycolate phosphatase-like HAD superfamily hydrolase